MYMHMSRYNASSRIEQYQSTNQMQVLENINSLHVMIVKDGLYDATYEIQRSGAKVEIEVGR